MMRLWDLWPYYMLMVAAIGVSLAIMERIWRSRAPRVVWRIYWTVVAVTLLVFVFLLGWYVWYFVTTI